MVKVHESNQCAPSAPRLEELEKNVDLNQFLPAQQVKGNALDSNMQDSVLAKLGTTKEDFDVYFTPGRIPASNLVEKVNLIAARILFRQEGGSLEESVVKWINSIRSLSISENNSTSELMVALSCGHKEARALMQDRKYDRSAPSMIKKADMMASRLNATTGFIYVDQAIRFGHVKELGSVNSKAFSDFKKYYKEWIEFGGEAASKHFDDFAENIKKASFDVKFEAFVWAVNNQDKIPSKSFLKTLQKHVIEMSNNISLTPNLFHNLSTCAINMKVKNNDESLLKRLNSFHLKPSYYLKCCDTRLSSFLRDLRTSFTTSDDALPHLKQYIVKLKQLEGSDGSCLKLMSDRLIEDLLTRAFGNDLSRVGDIFKLLTQPSSEENLTKLFDNLKSLDGDFITTNLKKELISNDLLISILLHRSYCCNRETLLDIVIRYCSLDQNDIKLLNQQFKTKFKYLSLRESLDKVMKNNPGNKEIKEVYQVVRNETYDIGDWIVDWMTWLVGSCFSARS